MTNINLTNILGANEKCWNEVPCRTHYSHHMYYNSPYETDSDCSNCNGACCESCKKIIEPKHFEFGYSLEILEEAIKQIAPELSYNEIYDLYECGHAEYNGEKYNLCCYPDDKWLNENHPELVEKLNSTVYYIEIDMDIYQTSNRSIYKTLRFRFNSVNEADIFFNSQKKVFKESLSNFKESEDDNFYYLYSQDIDNRKEGSITSVSIRNITSKYCDVSYITFDNEE